MTYYRQVGLIPPKRHTAFRTADGDLYYEELVSHEGFWSRSSLLYHQHPPSELTRIDPVATVSDDSTPNQPFGPRHLRCHELGLSDGDAVTGRSVLLTNPDCRISYVATPTSSGLYRNAVGDELVFVEQGRGSLDSQFGSVAFAPGDHVVIPRATTHRWRIDEGDCLRALVVESSGHFDPPRRYLSDAGQFLEHSPYCERDLRMPTEPLVEEGTDVEVLVRNRFDLSTFVYRHHPFDVAGWDGCVYPFVLSIHDFEPITGRIHQPPPVHQTFAAPNLVVCAFVPRLFDYHPDAIPAPYHHTNVDTDEVLFYLDGDFMSRKGSGVGVGSITLHPAGHTHGPQPGSIEASIGAEATAEYALMIDTFTSLDLAPSALEVDDGDYLQSWRSPTEP